MRSLLEVCLVPIQLNGLLAGSSLLLVNREHSEGYRHIVGTLKWGEVKQPRR